MLYTNYIWNKSQIWNLLNIRLINAFLARSFKIIIPLNSTESINYMIKNMIMCISPIDPVSICSQRLPWPPTSQIPWWYTFVSPWTHEDKCSTIVGHRYQNHLTQAQRRYDPGNETASALSSYWRYTQERYDRYSSDAVSNWLAIISVVISVSAAVPAPQQLRKRFINLFFYWFI